MSIEEKKQNILDGIMSLPPQAQNDVLIEAASKVLHEREKRLCDMRGELDELSEMQDMLQKKFSGANSPYQTTVLYNGEDVFMPRL